MERAAITRFTGVLRTGGWSPGSRKAAPPAKGSRPSQTGSAIKHKGSRPSQTGSAIKHKVRRSEPPSDYDIRQVWGPLRMTCTVSHLPWALCLLTVWLTLWAACRRRAPHIPQLVQEAACATVRWGMKERPLSGCSLNQSLLFSNR